MKTIEELQVIAQAIKEKLKGEMWTADDVIAEFGDTEDGPVLFYETDTGVYGHSIFHFYELGSDLGIELHDINLVLNDAQVIDVTLSDSEKQLYKAIHEQ